MTTAKDDIERRMARFHLDATDILEKVMYRRNYSPLVREQIIERLERITARELGPKIREVTKLIEKDVKKRLRKEINLTATRGAGSVA